MMLPLMAVAQLGAGQWKIHPYYVGGSAKNCIDTGDKVFYLAGGSLYYFDKASETNHEIDAISGINDINISQIYYNYPVERSLMCLPSRMWCFTRSRPSTTSLLLQERFM